MISSKFGIGQKVRHSLLGYIGVIVDVDPEYSLSDSLLLDEVSKNNTFQEPWYHVIMEDDKGQTMHTYLAESQLSWSIPESYIKHSSLNNLAASIRKQLKTPRLRH